MFSTINRRPAYPSRIRYYLGVLFLFFLIGVFDLHSFAESGGLSLAIVPAGTAWSFGYNGNGELGLGVSDSIAHPTPTPIKEVATIGSGDMANAMALAAGSNHSLALKSDGTVAAWGANNFGQVGDGTSGATPVTTPTLVVSTSGSGTLSNVTAIAAGTQHSLALLSDGTVVAWGKNAAGQLGNNTTTTTGCQCIPTPVQVVDSSGTGTLSNVIAIAGGELLRSVALKSDGTVWAWGANGVGQLGDGTTTDSPKPVQVKDPTGAGNLTDIIAIAAGYEATAALKSDGTVLVWGYNQWGQLGNGTSDTTAHPLPVAIGSLSNVIAIYGSTYAAFYVLHTDSTVSSWGYNFYGELGNGTDNTTGCLCNPSPGKVKNTSGTGDLTGVVSLSGAGRHALALTPDGTVLAWGDNANGELGNGGTSPSFIPVAASVTDQTMFAVGEQHSLTGAGILQKQSTPMGINIPATAVGVAINFASVTQGGNTSFTAIDPTTTGGTVPAGHSLDPSYPGYDLTTTASFTGDATVCIHAPLITNPTIFANLKLLHKVGSQLVDVTSGVDFSAKLVCGKDTTLSPFVISNSNSPTAGDSTVNGRVITSDGTPVSGTGVTLEGSQSRRTITDASGNYRFDNVETNGFYTVTPSRANYSFNPSMRSFSQLGNQTEAVFIASPIGVRENPLDTAEYFVRQHYLDFLGREPDESGFNFWSDQILECGNDASCIERRRINVSGAYFLSIEFQRTGGFVDGLYRASYGRPPLYREFIPDTGSIAHNVIVGRNGWERQLTANIQSFVNEWVQRADFRTAYDGLSNDLYVEQLISHTGISFAQNERESLISGLGTGGLSRADVLKRIAEDERFVKAKSNETFVMMEYFGYLRRDPDTAGFDFWLDKLNNFNGNFVEAEMVKAFITSSEYRQRFGR